MLRLRFGFKFEDVVKYLTSNSQWTQKGSKKSDEGVESVGNGQFTFLSFSLQFIMKLHFILPEIHITSLVPTNPECLHCELNVMKF
ncbi:CLUMA_CG002729, isoform A [Clunio marinus]|uniref:CLUMA_CG002729, isoform A n=1 Tax=Clunio marinus TaxID=568069 RepID=A0A1J1HLB5_9DIPT|nr:CLUMA_CG002729, isoform A [Clunio marinus]